MQGVIFFNAHLKPTQGSAKLSRHVDDEPVCSAIVLMIFNYIIIMNEFILNNIKIIDHLGLLQQIRHCMIMLKVNGPIKLDGLL